MATRMSTASVVEMMSRYLQERFTRKTKTRSMSMHSAVRK